jgi:uncharacterized membrane protein HdeD (DUF308 family)
MNDQDELRREQIQAVRAGVTNRLGDMWWAMMLRGGLAVALGIFALFWPTLTLGILALVVGVYCLADGATGLYGALQMGDRGEYLVQALISLAIGLVLVFWPSGSLRSLLFLFGAWVLFVGVSQFLSARRLRPTDPEQGPLKTMGIAGAVLGLVLMLWPGSGIVALSWVIAIAALVMGGMMIYLALRFRKLEQRAGMPLR